MQKILNNKMRRHRTLKKWQWRSCKNITTKIVYHSTINKGWFKTGYLVQCNCLAATSETDWVSIRIGNLCRTSTSTNNSWLKGRARYVLDPSTESADDKKNNCKRSSTASTLPRQLQRTSYKRHRCLNTSVRCCTVFISTPLEWAHVCWKISSRRRRSG